MGWDWLCTFSHAPRPKVNQQMSTMISDVRPTLPLQMAIDTFPGCPGEKGLEHYGCRGLEVLEG